MKLEVGGVREGGRSELSQETFIEMIGLIYGDKGETKILRHPVLFATPVLLLLTLPLSIE